jgi:putative hydrolase of the HAD superfamily
MQRGVVLWDFDGTLAWREGLWSGCVLEILDEHEPGHRATVELVRKGMRGGFPWHRHERPHPELGDTEAWWAHVSEMIAAALVGCGISAVRARELTPAVRTRFLDAARGWHVFEDAPAALERCRQGGWRNVILSNHVPELDELVQRLGLSELVERTFSSARTGYEKPHREAFLGALRACGQPRRRWMIGDNPVADFDGAEAVGIPAILIRTAAAERPRSAPDAGAAAALLLA